MRTSAKVVLAGALFTLAVGCATVSTYLCSILWRGEWRYPEMIAAICGSAALGGSALGGAALILRGRRVWALLIVGCLVATGGTFCLSFANCRLSCSDKVMTQSRSPDGQWKAYWHLEECTARARHCDPISRVMLVHESAGQSPREQDAFSIASDGIQLEWKSKDRLLISYPAWVRILTSETGSAAYGWSIGLYRGCDQGCAGIQAPIQF